MTARLGPRGRGGRAGAGGERGRGLAPGGPRPGTAARRAAHPGSERAPPPAAPAGPGRPLALHFRTTGGNSPGARAAGEVDARWQLPSPLRAWVSVTEKILSAHQSRASRRQIRGQCGRQDYSSPGAPSASPRRPGYRGASRRAGGRGPQLGPWTAGPRARAVGRRLRARRAQLRGRGRPRDSWVPAGACGRSSGVGSAARLCACGSPSPTAPLGAWGSRAGASCQPSRPSLV